MFSLGGGAQCWAAVFASVGILVIQSSVLKIVKKNSSKLHLCLRDSE